MNTKCVKISFKFVLIADIYFVDCMIVTLNKKSIVKFIFFLYLFFNCQNLLRKYFTRCNNDFQQSGKLRTIDAIPDRDLYNNRCKANMRKDTI